MPDPPSRPVEGEKIWRCESEHLDDFHVEVPADERCSRCGGAVRAYVPVSALNRALQEQDEARDALRTIRGPEDQGRWMGPYRAAGGGYEGLQAIAGAALGEPGTERVASRSDEGLVIPQRPGSPSVEAELSSLHALCEQVAEELRYESTKAASKRDQVMLRSLADRLSRE